MASETDLNEIVQDALKEIGNIGSSHAANSLSDTLGTPIDMINLGVKDVKNDEFSRMIEDEKLVVSTFSLEGGVSGTILLFFPLEQAIRIAKLMGKPTNLKEVDEMLQKVGRDMANSFSDSMSDFFGVEVKTLPSQIDDEDVTSIDDLLKALNIWGENIFFNTTLVNKSKKLVSRLFLFLNDDDVGRMMGLEVPDFAGEGVTFSDMLGSFEEIKDLEVKIGSYLKVLKVPKEVKREFLRDINPETFKNNQLKLFLENMLKDIGIGKKITLDSPKPLKYIFKVEDCNVCNIVEAKGVPACHTTTTALGRIFMEPLKLGNSVEETECSQLGSDSCVHEVSLEQIDVFSILPVPRDIEVLKAIKKGINDSQAIEETTKLDAKNIQNSIDVLRYYGIIEESQKGIELSDLGAVFITFAENAPPEEEGDLKGWDDLEKLKVKAKEAEEAVPDETEEEAPWS